MAITEVILLNCTTFACLLQKQKHETYLNYFKSCKYTFVKLGELTSKTGRFKLRIFSKMFNLTIPDSREYEELPSAKD